MSPKLVGLDDPHLPRPFPHRLLYLLHLLRHLLLHYGLLLLLLQIETRTTVFHLKVSFLLLYLYTQYIYVNKQGYS